MGQSLPNLSLNTNKNLKDILSITIRQTEKGGLIEATILNDDGSPYDLTDMHVTFQENKANNTWLSDDKVTIKDAKNAVINYVLHDQAYSGKGVAWFEISNSNGTKVDSTQSFYIEVESGLTINAYNSTYISDLDVLRDRMQKMVDAATALSNQFNSDVTKTIADANSKASAQRTDINNQWQTQKQGFDKAFADFKTQYTKVLNDNKNLDMSRFELKSDSDLVRTRVTNLENSGFAKIKQFDSDTDAQTWSAQNHGISCTNN